MTQPSTPRWRKADLHVHSHHSAEHIRYGPLSADFRPTCEPVELAERSIRAGMDFFALTDHDTIDGCNELLDRRPELASRTIVASEVTSYFPRSRHELHVSVLGIDARRHREIQARRHDLLRLVAYLRRERVVYVLNHPIWDAEGRRWTLPRLIELVRLIRDHFPVIEGRNGASLPYQNRVASAIARRLQRFVIGGSDTHSDQVGYAWTEAPGDTPAAFLDSIRQGRVRPAGRELTLPFFTHEMGRLLRANVGRRRRVLGRLTGAMLALGAEVLHDRLTRLLTRLYLRCQRGTAPGALRQLERVLPAAATAFDFAQSNGQTRRITRSDRD